MMDLKDKKCVPCHSYVPPLPLEEKKKLLASLSGDWRLIENDSRIRKDFKFKNFKRALEFANAVGAVAEAEKHHPEIFLGWGHCDVEIWTHANNNLIENDFILAAKIDAEFLKLYPKDEA
ncbi:MAG: 4a-hydroxytetrahydrobiopterin dehydratase [Bacteriovoracaceae bacterium]